MKTAIDLVRSDLATLEATMRTAYVALQTHPDYGDAESDYGVFLCDIGQLLIDSAARAGRLNRALDGETLEAA
jgi:hypothetical protein